MLFSFAPVFIPVLALSSLLDAIGALIVPAIIVIFWVIGAIANQLAKKNQKKQPDADAAEKLRERRRRMEAALGLPPDSLRGPGESAPTQPPVRPPALPGRDAEPRREPKPVHRPAPVQQTPVQQTPPQVRRSQPKQARQAKQVTPAQTGVIGATEIGAAEIGSGKTRADLPVVLNRAKKPRHPIAAMLRDPKTVRQLIAAREVLDRPKW